MKKTAIFLMLLFGCAGVEPKEKVEGVVELLPSLINGRCSVCMKLKLKSTVRCNGVSSCTVMYCGSGYFDENGDFNPPEPCNTCTTYCECSQGHTIVIRSKQ